MQTQSDDSLPKTSAWFRKKEKKNGKRKDYIHHPERWPIALDPNSSRRHWLAQRDAPPLLPWSTCTKPPHTPIHHLSLVIDNPASPAVSHSHPYSPLNTSNSPSLASNPLLPTLLHPSHILQHHHLRLLSISASTVSHHSLLTVQVVN
jgi:hypothetical protein